MGMFSPQPVNWMSSFANRARSVFACAWMIVLLGAAPEKPAQPTPPQKTQSPRESGIRSAQIITVPLPIVGTVDTTIKRQVDNLVSNHERSAVRPVLIFEFLGK